MADAAPDKSKALEDELFGGSDSEEDERALAAPQPKSKKAAAPRKRSRGKDKAAAAAAAGAAKKAKKAKKAKFASQAWGGEAAEGGEAGGGEAGLEDSEDDGEGQETAADRAFIDRSGELEAEDPFADSSDDDDEAGDAPQAEEAEEGEPEEEDDLADAFKSKSRGKRRVMDHEVLVAHAESLLEKMKAAYEADLQSGHRRQPQKRKLLMLRDVVAAFQDHYMSEVLLCESDGLTVLRMWLEPMPATMVLPNVKLRTEIFRVLRDVNLEVEREDVKERLKKSQLAKVIMFYSKVGDELVDNRRICQRLIQTWSEAIFGKMTRHSAEVDTEEESARVGRLRAKSLQEQKDSYGGKDLKRMHAFVPAPVPMDFVHRPKHGMRDDHMGKSEYKMEKEKKLKKKLAGITAKNKKGQGQASNVSVEGRGLVVNL